MSKTKVDDPAMKDIEKLYRRLFLPGSEECVKIDVKVRAEIFKKIMEDVDRLQEEQRQFQSWTQKYRMIDRAIRQRLLKEVQVIIDDYTIAKQTDQVPRWESMYGDIEHYKAVFYRIRMDRGYEKKRKASEMPTEGFKIVKGEWEKVEYIKLR
ncbi:MAG: hypothetical protein HZA19_07035 [Nitrospirae bacterium]|nr:hypothetical protein [Nitrospirota bacterium]